MLCGLRVGAFGRTCGWFCFAYAPECQVSGTGRQGEKMANDKVTLTDHRNQKSYELPLTEGHTRAPDLQKNKTSPDDFGMMSYDPAFMNTASCKSAVTY